MDDSQSSPATKNQDRMTETGGSWIDKDTAMHLAAVYQKPYTKVGPLLSGVRSLPTGRDFASQILCKSQRYTSWDLFSRSYLCYLATAAPSVGGDIVDRIVETEDKIPQEVWDSLSNIKKKMVDKGIYVYNHKTKQIEDAKISKISVVETKYTEEGCSTSSSNTKELESQVAQLVKDLEDANTKYNDATAKKDNVSAAKIAELMEDIQTNLKLYKSKISISLKTVNGNGKSNLKNVIVKMVGSYKHITPAQLLGKPLSEKFTNITKIPIRYFQSSSSCSQYEMNLTIPYSILWSSLHARLMDPSQTGTLGSIIKSPTVRDAAGIMSLVKAIKQNPTSVLDVSPLFNLICMANSLNLDLYRTDPTENQFIRNMTPTPYSEKKFTLNISKHRSVPFSGSIIAVTFDNFLAHMRGGFNTNIPDPFSYSYADVEWVAVPVRSQWLNQRGCLPFLISHCHSAYWHGRINVTKVINWIDTETGSLRNDIVSTTIPTSNCVYNPGPKNIIVVLGNINSDNAPPSIEVGGFHVPVFKGTPNTIPVPSLYEIWEHYFKTENIDYIRSDLTSAIKEGCTKMSVSNTCELAYSMASDVMYSAKPGLLRKAETGTSRIEYSRDNMVWGAVVFGDGQHGDDGPLFKGSTLKIKEMAWSQLNHPDYKKYVNGYNWAGVSALHLPPNGVAPLATSVVDKGSHNGIYIDAIDPQDITTQYTIPKCSSLSRLAIQADLILTHHSGIIAENVDAVGCWTLNNATAMLCSTAAFLVSNNICLNVWAGYHTVSDPTYMDWQMNTFKDMLTQGFVNHVSLSRSTEYWKWTIADVNENYNIMAFDDPDWLNCSPVPINLFVQWIEKLKFPDFDGPNVAIYIRYEQQTYLAIPYDRGQKFKLNQLVGSIDTDRSFPVQLCRNDSDEKTVRAMWIDQDSYISLGNSGAAETCDPKFLNTKVSTLSPVNSSIAFMNDDRIFVFNSMLQNNSSIPRYPKVNAILYPDPPSFTEVIDIAKNYLVNPALAAMGGWLAGGPTGAVISAAGTIGGQVITDLMKKDTEKELVERTASKVLKDIHTQPVDVPVVQAPPPAATEQPVNELGNVGGASSD